MKLLLSVALLFPSTVLAATDIIYTCKAEKICTSTTNCKPTFRLYSLVRLEYEDKPPEIYIKSGNDLLRVESIGFNKGFFWNTPFVRHFIHFGKAGAFVEASLSTDYENNIDVIETRFGTCEGIQ